ncbi:MAG: hypothetical protein E7244_27775 [Enterocloster citroniae]|nr:hypothetical protein [Enterocloster citroniae]
MDKPQKLYSQIQDLHKTYGASLPGYVFTEEVYKMLLVFKEMQMKINWLDDELIWALANIDRYNGHTFGSK